MKYEIASSANLNAGDGIMRTFHLIRAVHDIPRHNIKAGELGGYIEKGSNLSQDGDCWVGRNSFVYEHAEILENALITHSPPKNAHIVCKQIIPASTLVYGHAKVFDHSTVCASGKVHGNAKVHGHAIICCCTVSGDADVRDKIIVAGNIRIDKKMVLCGDAAILDATQICHSRGITVYRDKAANIVVTGITKENEMYRQYAIDRFSQLLRSSRLGQSLAADHKNL